MNVSSGLGFQGSIGFQGFGALQVIIPKFKPGQVCLAWFPTRRRCIPEVPKTPRLAVVEKLSLGDYDIYAALPAVVSKE